MSHSAGALRRVLASTVLRRVALNSGARLAAVVGLAAATVFVGRIGGPEAVGAYALLRMLPGLVGVLAVAGLPGALAYFLAEPRRGNPHLWPTVLVVALAGAALGTVSWCLAAPLLRRAFFPDASPAVVVLAGATVATQLLLTVGKTALQGLDDRRGGDAVIAAEELAFVPCYLVLLPLSGHGDLTLVLGLALADLGVAAAAWRRVGVDVRAATGRPFRPWRGGVSPRLRREIVGYGLRGQIGGVVALLNLRLDFAILGAMAGPAVLGTYAVASKYAELLRLPGTALTWVSYPSLARLTPTGAARHARRLALPALGAVWLLGIPLFVLTGPLIGLMYGGGFADAVPQARVLFAGMLLAGGAGVASGYLYARGRPGLNSIAMGVGLVLTVVLDVALIPAHGAMGAAWASTAAYLCSDGCALWLLTRLSRTVPEPTEPLVAPQSEPVAP